MKGRFGIAALSCALALIAPFALFSACGTAEDTPAEHAQADTLTKKGVGVSRYNPYNSACSLSAAEKAKRIDDLGASWYYDWGHGEPVSDFRAEYVPMVWGADSVNETTVATIRQRYEAGKYKQLLTFNEPDKKGAGISSDVSVATALDLWERLESIGIPLSSPAPAEYDHSKKTNWLDEFMAGAKTRGYRVDFIAVHVYQDFSDPNAAVAELKEKMETLYQRYSLPIWITEFGAIDIGTWAGNAANPACNEQNAKTYCANAARMLESLGFVERYAWFVDNYSETGSARPDEGLLSALYTDANNLSATGKAYKAIPSAQAMYWTNTEPAEGTGGKKYSHTLSVCGGTGKYTFAAEDADELPNGLKLLKNGRLVGTPTETGVFRFKAVATDENGQTTYREYKLKIV